MRAAVAAGTPVGLRAKDIMARGELVPDDVVVAIIADRIAAPDCAEGFILDGFPRTVPQAIALDRLLAEKGIKLDAVIELRVNEAILLQRVETRIAQMRARGEPIRADDNAESLAKRLDAYRSQTAPLVEYYGEKGALTTIDGMMAIDEVSAAIARALAAITPAKSANVPGKASAKAPGDARGAAGAEGAKSSAAGKRGKRAGKKAAAKGVKKSAKKATKKSAKKAAKKKAVKKAGAKSKSAVKGKAKAKSKAKANSKAKARGKAKSKAGRAKGKPARKAARKGAKKARR